MSLSRSVYAIALVLASLAAFGDGTLTVNGKTVKLNHAYATTRKNAFDKKKTDVYLLFTDQEMPSDILKDEFGLMEVKTPFSAVTAEVDPDNKVISGEVYSPALKENMHQFSSVGTQQVEVKTKTASRIAGKLYMPKPDDF